MKVFANPKTLFKRDCWIKRMYYAVRSWFRYTFDKRHLALVRGAFNGRPWDYSFLISLEYNKIKEMVHYHQRAKRFEGVEYVIRDMKICLSLIEIFTGERNTFHFTGGLKFVETDKKTEQELGERELFEIKPTDDFQYHCDVLVNTKNVRRFVKNEKLIPFYIEHPHELYELKARYLYHKIRFEKEEEWWD